MGPAGYVNFREMAERCELHHDELHELIEYGVLPVLHVNSIGLCFPAASLGPAQRAARIRRDYALDLFAMGLVMGYIQKIDDLETANAALRTSLKNSVVGGSDIICDDLK